MSFPTAKLQAFTKSSRPCFAGWEVNNENARFDHIQNAGSDQQRIARIASYLKHVVEQHRLHPESDQQLAYGVAGLLSLDQVRQLPADHPCLQAIEICAELELPAAHRGSAASWDALEALVEHLEPAE